MKFRPSTHPDFRLESVQDGYNYYIGFLGTPEEFQTFAKQSNIRPYVIDVDSDNRLISRTPGYLTWVHAYPGYKPISGWVELFQQVIPELIKSGELVEFHKVQEFIKKFPCTTGDFQIYRGAEILHIARTSMDYNGFYQGVKLI